MSVKIGSATDYADLLNQLDSFLTSTGMALTPSFSGAGNGKISALGGSASVAETITVTFTDATNFGVAGSVSGSLGSGTVGSAFVSTKANFTITAGSVAFSSGDIFTFAVAPPWTSMRRTAGSEMIWSAPGNGGLDQILVGAKTFDDVGTDYYNWRLGGFTAYNAGSAFNQQPGYVGGIGQAHPSPVFTLWNSTIPYWFIANGRRVIVVAKVSTVYVSCYLGLASSYMAPGAFPYPLIVGGNLAFYNEPATTSPEMAVELYGRGDAEFRAAGIANLSADYQSSLMLRLPSGSWRGFDENNGETQFGQMWPGGYVGISSYDWRPNLDGGYPIFPVVMFDGTPNIYGELDGVHSTSGFSQGAENTITAGGVDYLVVQNVYANTKSDFFVVRLS